MYGLDGWTKVKIAPPRYPPDSVKMPQTKSPKPQGVEEQGFQRRSASLKETDDDSINCQSPNRRCNARDSDYDASRSRATKGAPFNRRDHEVERHVTFEVETEGVAIAGIVWRFDRDGVFVKRINPAAQDPVADRLSNGDRLIAINDTLVEPMQGSDVRQLWMDSQSHGVLELTVGHVIY
jgi:hypothetical protein